MTVWMVPPWTLVVCILKKMSLNLKDSQQNGVTHVWTAVTWPWASELFSSSALSWRRCEGAAISWPRMVSLISLAVKDAILTLLRLPKSYWNKVSMTNNLFCVCIRTAKIRSFIATSTLIHSSSLSEGQTKWGSVMVDLSGWRTILAFSLFTCRPRRRRIRRENAV